MNSTDKRKQTPPPLQPTSRDDLSRLRSASPAVKRPASDMGAQDREEHLKDVEMVETSPPKFVVTSETPSASDMKKQDTGSTHGDRDTNAPQNSQPDPPQQDMSGARAAASVSISPLPVLSVRSTGAAITPAIPPNSADIPSYDEQVRLVTHIAEQEREEGQKGYLIPTRWWNRILARSSHPPANADKDAMEGNVGPIDNASLALITEDSGKLLDLAGDKFVTLRPGLRYGDDYHILPQAAWDLVLSWYGAARDSPVITRYAYDLRADDNSLPNVDFETDPPIFTILKVISDHTTQSQKEALDPPPRMVASKYMLANEWLTKAKELVHIDLKTKVRVWRILGGLKSHADSGLPSPAASRSSSPAPGTEMVATVPDRMLLDVNTFVALKPAEHRDDMNMEDNTGNKNYNGKSKLGIYAGRNDLIALEEQKKTGSWPSETARLALPKNTKDKVKGITPSGRTSPSPGMTTRGRSRREGRPRGNAGLTNLGNTCYMNAGLQSIRNVQELTEYFLSEKWRDELNKENPLGHNGLVAKAYGHLIKGIFSENGGAFTPRDFKNIVGRFNPSFSGYGQQDSQEFLLFLLNGLAEDLNRIHKKPYIERPDSTDEMVHDEKALKDFADRNWADYKARNDSVITDLFAGMYKSTLTCPVCDKVSIILDPFVNLTLQLPIESTWSMTCFFLPLYGPPKQIEVEVDKHASVSAVKDFVAGRTKIDTEKMIMSEGYKNRYYKIFDNTVVISEAGINLNSDIVYFQELEDIPTNYNPNKKQAYGGFSTSNQSDEIVDVTSPKADKLLVPIFHRHVKNPDDPKRVSQRPFFGYGSYIVIDRDENKSYNAILRKIIGKVTGMTSKNILEDLGDEDSSDSVMVNDDSSRSVTHSNEDGFVDISMRDGSTAPSADVSPIAQFVSAKGPVPKALESLFTVGVKSTGEGIPMGWNNISEHDDFTLMKTRLPKKARRATPSSEESAESAADESVADSDASTDHVDEDPLKPAEDEDTAAMFNNFKAANRNKHNQTVYGKRNRRNDARRLPRASPKVQQQPTPARDEEIDMLVRPGEAIICDWFPEAYDAFFGAETRDEDTDRGYPSWLKVPVMEDAELSEKRRIRNRRKREGVTLGDCLNEFHKAETLSEQNSWYCPRCKEHRRAEKKFELWKVPDILIMHLKRFSSTRNLRDKLDLNVEYPVEGLDMSKYVQDAEGKSMIYDLIAVDNHYGGLGGGHYTAYAKNATTQDWFEFNDSHVSKRSAEQVVTPSAYILFYRRRGDYPLGGEKLQGMLSADDGHTSDAGSDELEAGAGNGRRLGDSSHPQIGSSGHGGVGASRHLEAGGLEDETHDPSADNDTQTTMQVDDDEGIEMDQPGTLYGPLWAEKEVGWGFDRILPAQGTSPNHDDVGNDAFGDGGSDDSTRAQNSPPGSTTSDMDVAMYSEEISGHDRDGDTNMRSTRESAPPPSYRVAVTGVEDDDIDDDADEDIPVSELVSDDNGDLQWASR